MTNKQRRFCEEYVISNNATAAAREAGYSHKTAEQLGYQTLQFPSVKAYIAELREEQKRKRGITQEDMIQLYVDLSTYDTSTYYNTIYRLSYVRADDPKGKRCLKRYGEEITDSEYSELPERYKPYYYQIERLKPLNSLTKAQRVAIQGITYDKNGNKVLKLSDKKAAADSLAKHLGMFVDKQEVKHSGEVVKRVINVNPSKG